MAALIDVREENASDLPEYARVPIAFEVRRVVDVAAARDGPGFTLSERAIDLPYVKDYDALDGETRALVPLKRFYWPVV